MIYLDAAATSFLKPPCVAEAVADAVSGLASPGRGAYPAALEASRTVWRCREKLAALFGGDAARVVFTSGLTEALNLVLWGLLEPGDHVITTVIEHNSVLRPLYLLQKQGIEVEILPADEMGLVDWSSLPSRIRPNTKAVVTTHASNVTGNMQDIRAIGRVCRKNGVFFILDTAQTAGTREIDMTADRISVLCFSGHKSLLGPQGIGGFCLAKDVNPRVFKAGGSGVLSFSREMPAALPERFEAGTLNTPGIAGLSAALDAIKSAGISSIQEKEHLLCNRFLAGAEQIPGLTLYGDVHARERAPVLLLNLAGIEAATLCDALSERYGICTRAGAHCAPLMHTALGTDKTGAVRFSFSQFNTERDIDAALAALRELAM